MGNYLKKRKYLIELVVFVEILNGVYLGWMYLSLRDVESFVGWIECCFRFGSREEVEAGFCYV